MLEVWHVTCVITDSDDDDMDVEECEESEMCLYQILGS